MQKHIYRLSHTVAGARRLLVVVVMDSEASREQIIAAAHARYGIRRDVTERAEIEHRPAQVAA